jgi:hypothetical protein
MGMFTPEGGVAIRFKNNTANLIKKGTLVYSDRTATEENSIAPTPAGNIEAIGVAYRDIPVGFEGFVVINGRAECLIEDNSVADVGNWCIPSLTQAGRVDASQPDPPNASTTAAHSLHFAEVGHCLGISEAGIDNFALVLLHFN